MKKILITGAAGFIGSHLSLALLKQGHRVIGVDNFQTGSEKNLIALHQHNNFKFIYADITNFCNINEEIDQIYHFACPAAPIHYQAEPVKTLKTGILGTLQLLEIANQKNARILFASTSEVYGSALQNPQKETYWGNVNPIGIRSCYDESKRVAETLCMDFHRQFKTDIRILRLFNTYGPHMQMNDGRIINNFIVQALKQIDITVYGDGKQTRSFCYVDDLVRGIILMMENNYRGPINLGNDREYQVVEIAERILSLINTTSKIKYLPLPKDDPPQRKPDISLANKELGWEPKIFIDEGIPKTIEYFKKVISD